MKTSLVLLMICFVSFLMAQNLRLIEFKIKDQFDNEYTEKDFLGKILVLVGSDKDGSQYNGIWTGAIKDSLKEVDGFEQIRFVGLADLRGVPFFLKGFVRGKFPKEKEKWVLMDWKGHFPQNYNFQKKASNILIFDQNGNLAQKTFGWQIDQTKLVGILNHLRTLMNNLSSK